MSARFRMVGHAGHLARRFVTSLSGRPPDVVDELWAESWLTPAERALWRRLPNPDRRHSIEVARRFNRQVHERAAMAGALLHDIGKIESSLGTFGRVLATVVGPRTDRFRRYLDHEAIGARMVEMAGAAPATVELVAGHGPLSDWLARCDDV